MAFGQSLQQLGWTVGHNLQVDIRWGAGDAERIRGYAAELLALGPDVILANGSPEMRALQQATRSLPIVFANLLFCMPAHHRSVVPGVSDDGDHTTGVSRGHQ